MIHLNYRHLYVEEIQLPIAEGVVSSIDKCSAWNSGLNEKTMILASYSSVMEFIISVAFLVSNKFFTPENQFAWSKMINLAWCAISEINMLFYLFPRSLAFSLI